jgi:hypothetical protein
MPVKLNLHTRTEKEILTKSWSIIVKRRKPYHAIEEESSVKIRSANSFWIIFLVLVAGGFIYALIPPRLDTNSQKPFAGTRQMLRQQGFKTDLTDFDFSTPPELRAREAILKATVPTNNFSEPFRDYPNLMETVGMNSAVVVWKQDSLKRMYRSGPDEGDELTWSDFRAALAGNQLQVDAAGAAVLSNPIAFNLDASHGSAMLLPHLAVLKNLTQRLGSRLVLALHDGDEGAAYTNLLAATRLVTAWRVEPAEISHLVCFADVKIVFAATWQALQTNNWPDDQLARLQAEWESVNLFTNLSEIVAFQRASLIAAYDYNRDEILHPSMPFKEFLRETWPNPLNALDQFQSEWRERAFLQGDRYDEEKDVLLFYRDREINRRNAVLAPTWMQMRRLPGVTNEILFQSKYNSRVQVMENMHRVTMTFQRQGSTFLGRAAEAEAERRVLITAIALERYRGKHGSYPSSLVELVPEFLPAEPLDFMDGQPLRYRLTDDGHFILYSIGVDCVDDGGKFPSRPKNTEDWQVQVGGVRMLGSDILWPLPASTANVAALRQKQKRAEELRALTEQDRESEADWQQSPFRQARVEKILAVDWSSTTNMEVYAGRPVVAIISNEKNSATNHPSLPQSLTPRQIITGNEPEELTFQTPVSYDVITNMGALVLLVDADIEESAMPDSGARIQDCYRAGNGDCLLVWHAIFDPPGRHAVQAQLILSTQRGGEYFLRGPAISVVTTNLCQFSLASATYDIERGAIFHAHLPEMKGLYTIECVTTNGAHLKTLAGSTTNGEFNLNWNLVDDQGHRLTGETFNTIVHITLPDSGRSQTVKGP